MDRSTYCFHVTPSSHLPERKMAVISSSLSGEASDELICWSTIATLPSVFSHVTVPQRPSGWNLLYVLTYLRNLWGTAGTCGQVAVPQMWMKLRLNFLKASCSKTMSSHSWFHLIVSQPHIVSFVSPQSTATHQSCTSTALCWSPSLVLRRCPTRCCRWKTPTARRSASPSTWSRAPPTDGCCSTEGRKVGNWRRTTPSPGRRLEAVGFDWVTKKTSPGQCHVFEKWEKFPAFSVKQPSRSNFSNSCCEIEY